MWHPASGALTPRLEPHPEATGSRPGTHARGSPSRQMLALVPPAAAHHTVCPALDAGFRVGLGSCRGRAGGWAREAPGAQASGAQLRDAWVVWSVCGLTVWARGSPGSPLCLRQLCRAAPPHPPSVVLSALRTGQSGDRMPLPAVCLLGRGTLLNKDSA